MASMGCHRNPLNTKSFLHFQIRHSPKAISCRSSSLIPLSWTLWQRRDHSFRFLVFEILHHNSCFQCFVSSSVNSFTMKGIPLLKLLTLHVEGIGRHRSKYVRILFPSPTLHHIPLSAIIFTTMNEQLLICMTRSKTGFTVHHIHFL